MKALYIAPFAVPSGYARASQDYMAALHAAGVDLVIQPLADADTDDLEPRYKPLLELLTHNQKVTPFSHVIVATIPQYCHEFVTGDLKPPKGTKRVAVTTWETDRFPAEDACLLDESFDAVVVPSQFVASAFTAAGLPKSKVHVIPHCFDPAFWWDRPDVATPRGRPQPYTFYSVGVWATRKSPIELLKAYFAAFRKHDNVHLKIVSPSVSMADVEALSDAMGIPDLPRVEFITERLSETQLRELHYTSDCYVSLSKGEAWGLGAFEAALAGNTIIVTGFSGWRDYLDGYSGTHYVNYLLTPAVTPESVVGLCGDQNWAEPGVTHAKQIMRDASQYEWGRRGDRERLERLYSYKTVGQQFRSLLENL
jgi:glycosyltransferase involved in cell wall biosynthesis